MNNDELKRLEALCRAAGAGAGGPLEADGAAETDGTGFTIYDVDDNEIAREIGDAAKAKFFAAAWDAMPALIVQLRADRSEASRLLTQARAEVERLMSERGEAMTSVAVWERHAASLLKQRDEARAESDRLRRDWDNALTAAMATERIEAAGELAKVTAERDVLAGNIRRAEELISERCRDLRVADKGDSPEIVLGARIARVLVGHDPDHVEFTENDARLLDEFLEWARAAKRAAELAEKGGEA